MEFSEEQQAHIDKLIKDEKEKWIEEELKPVQTQVKELEQYKPKKKTDKEIEIENKQKELFDKEKNLTLKEHGLQDFADFFIAKDMDDLNTKVNSFKQIMETKNTYKPKDHKQTDAYTKSKKQGDTLGMVKALFSK